MVSDNDRVGPTVEDGLREALSLLTSWPIASVLRFASPAPEPGPPDTGHGTAPRYFEPPLVGSVDLYRIRVGLVLPIGVGELSERVRALLAAGFDGWSMPALPAEPQPLHTVEDHLPIKVVNLLRRRRFRSVEEVALVPDDTLLDLRGLGTRLLRELRRVIPARTAPGHTRATSNEDSAPLAPRPTGGTFVETDALAELVTIRGDTEAAVFTAAATWLAAHPHHTLFGVDYDHGPVDGDGVPQPAAVLRLTVMAS
ncbi:hypothetical protein DI005_20660 [Prauserella sp. PE36]|nr:hypothetical protein DI005_20660 [Prauserella sp. PE36]